MQEGESSGEKKWKIDGRKDRRMKLRSKRVQEGKSRQRKGKREWGVKVEG